MNSTSPLLTIGVIGCGHWGPNHIRAFMSLPGVRVAWAVDPSPHRREHIARLHGGVRLSPDSRSLLEDPSVDAVVIATSAASHYELCLAAIRHGKHVLCEKPLCLRSGECEDLVTMARQAGVVLMVGHVFLFNSGILKIRELLDRNELGTVYYASATRTNLGPIRHDANAAYDLASHEISIFNFLFDSPPQSVSAIGRRCVSARLEDVVFISMRYPADVVVHAMASWLSPRKVREITLVGEKKMITWNDMAPGPLAIYDKGAIVEPFYENFGEFQLAVREGDVTVPKLSAEEPLRGQARFFLDAVAKGSAGICSGERACDVIRTLEAIDVSLRGGGTPVDIRPSASAPAR
jgi:predicted dehydrogenase